MWLNLRVFSIFRYRVWVSRLPARNLVYIGLRDLDDYERYCSNCQCSPSPAQVDNSQHFSFKLYYQKTQHFGVFDDGRPKTRHSWSHQGLDQTSNHQVRLFVPSTSISKNNSNPKRKWKSVAVARECWHRRSWSVVCTEYGHNSARRFDAAWVDGHWQCSAWQW